MEKIVDGNLACSEIAYLFSEVASIYPITPSSPMASNVDALTDKKKNLFNNKVKVVEMQSEAGAAGAMHGALITGSLASTYTASQGLLLMLPNMYKMAGEMLPGVIHVAARSLATHALSIFGDHQDVYATRSSGFCMLASTSVSDAQNMAAVAHLSAIEGSLPFLHFFDGFRTSHEINKIKTLDDSDLLKLINYDKVYEFKNRMLKVNSDNQMGMAENEDIYFQSMEARNNDYLNIPKIVDKYMSKINKLIGTDYKPFNYYGADNATNIIVAMGSVCDTLKLVVNDLVSKGESVGVVEVHLYRPFSSEYLLNVLPSSVKNIAVLDRTKEAGSVGEPLYLDIVAALSSKDINIVGGRYGLSSKNTTDSDIYAVYKMLKGTLKNNFTIGINDDVTNTSLPSNDYTVSLNTKELLIYGFGSDGMVSTSKELMKTIGEDKFVQGYFQYDSKKSGGITISNLRISDDPINVPYYVKCPNCVVITKESYLGRLDMISNIVPGGIVLINTKMSKDSINNNLTNEFKKVIKDRNINLLIIDADSIASEFNIKGKISKIFEVILLNLLGVNNAISIVEKSIVKNFSTKGLEIVNANLSVIKKAVNSVYKVDNITYTNDFNDTKLNVFEKINNLKGNTLTVSELSDFKCGSFKCGNTKCEKRNISNIAPKWVSENCIQCNQCSLVCPHAVIRPTIVDKTSGVPMIGSTDNNYELFISEADCTGCGLCIETCPGMRGNKALVMGDVSVNNNSKEYVLNCQTTSNIDKFTIKGSQFEKPLFEFSGACAGCGETPYIKLLTQLFGKKLVIANATGCSSIYGGSAPSTPYSIPWANSLFEDNAEFGYGMKISHIINRNRAINIIEESIDSVNDDVKVLYNEFLNNKDSYEITNDIKNKLVNMEIPNDLRGVIDYLPANSIWCIGGDGWAYDIGFGGIDHVLSSNENINILVLDTEVYSNTGGQASKSSRFGAIAEFANFGKRSSKKDMFRIAMSYPNCYVASISLGANMMQTIKAFKEAEAHDGPSIIIAYSPCIEHGIKGGMKNSIEEQKLAVNCGYINLMRYDGSSDKLYIDSKEPDFSLYDSFLSNEVRYNALKIKDESLASELLNLNKESAMKRYNYYKNILDNNKTSE